MRLRRERRAWRGMRLQAGFCVFVACGFALGTASCDDWYWDSSVYDGLMQNFDIETNKETGKSTVAQQARISYDGPCSSPESLAENWLRCSSSENEGQLATCEPVSLRDLIVLRFNDYSYHLDKKKEDGNTSKNDDSQTGTQSPMAQVPNENKGFIVETYCSQWSGVDGLPPECENNRNDQASASAPAGGTGEATRLLCKKIGYRIVVDGKRTDCAHAEDEAAKALCRLYKDESNEAFIHAFNYRACPKNYNYREAYVVIPTEENLAANRYRNVCVQASCNGELVDLLFDNANCGVCGNTCGGEAFCENGLCTKCKGGMEECGGGCTDFKANHVSSCHDKGVAECVDGYADLDGNVENGCEYNKITAHVVSFDDSKKIAQCEDGYADLDQKLENGCETNLEYVHIEAFDTEHGVIKCAAGYCDRDGNIGNGCEYDMLANHVVKCSAEGIVCEDGYEHCPGNGDGCKTNVMSDINNCGKCGNICGKMNPIEHATSYTCDGRRCGVTECDKDFFPSIDRTKCEETGDVENCGATNYNCRDRVKGWLDGVCMNNTCVATECKPDGYLLGNNGMCLYTACANDSVCSGATNACGEGKVCVCRSANGIVCSGSQPYCHSTKGCAQCSKNEHCMAENATGVCRDGMCEFTCSKGYYSVKHGGVFEKCELNSDTHCGNVDTDCSKDADNRYCNVYEGKCVECTSDDHCSSHGGLGMCNINNECQIVTCPRGTHFYKGTCEADSAKHCGSHDRKCDKNKYHGVEFVDCEDGACVIKQCKRGYALGWDGSCYWNGYH